MIVELAIAAFVVVFLLRRGGPVDRWQDRRAKRRRRNDAIEAEHRADVVTKALQARRCKSCGGFCDGDIDRCFANMEAASEAQVGGGIASARRCDTCGGSTLQTNDPEMSYCQRCEQFEPYLKPRLSPAMPGVSVDVRAENTSISVRGGGHVSINVEEKRRVHHVDVGMVSVSEADENVRRMRKSLRGHPVGESVFKPSRHRSD